MAWKRDVLPKDTLFKKAHSTIIQVGNRANDSLPLFDVPQDQEKMDQIKAIVTGYRNELQNLIDLSPPGMNAYGQDQFGDPAFDAGAEFIAVRDAVDAVIAAVDALTPIGIREMHSPADMNLVRLATIALAQATGLP